LQCIAAPDLSVIPTEAGTQKLVGLDSRLRGNDMGGGDDTGVELVPTPIGRPTLRPIVGLCFRGNDNGEPGLLESLT